MASKIKNKKTKAIRRKAELAAPIKAPKKPALKEKVQTRIVFTEAGTSGLKEIFGFVAEAYNQQLYWPQVQPLYSRLRRSMPEIVMIRNAYTAWARNVKPVVDLPDKPSDDDKRYQEFIVSDFDNMHGGFGGFIDTAVNQVPFMGWGWWEALPGVRDPNWQAPGDDEWQSEADDGLIGMRRLAWRDSSTFFGWDFDDKKRLRGMIQQDFSGLQSVVQITLPLYDRRSGRFSLHMTYGDPTNPEGLSPLEAVWRLERMKYGYEVVHGIGSEHTAGYLSIKKTSDGVISDDDEERIEETANNLMSAQEGNYGYFPFGLEGEIMDVPFSGAGGILEMIKHLSIEVLSVYSMQFIALNTLTNTGAQASQVDSTDTGVFTFNSMIDGFATQYDQQVGKRLFEMNKASFPGITKRPKIRFSHIDRAIALNDLANFYRTLDGVIMFTPEDERALRQRSGFLPTNIDADAIRKQQEQARIMDQKKLALAAGNANGNNQPANVQDNKQPAKSLSELGGPGSGNEGHAGRPGLIGGSQKHKSMPIVTDWTDGKQIHKYGNAINSLDATDEELRQ